MRRQEVFTVTCAHPGCEKTARYTYHSRKALAESFEYKRYILRHQPYHCAKHNPQHTLLSPGVLTSAWFSMPSQASEGCAPEDRFFGNSGILYGPGFFADAKDFPIGTRIRVTAEVILPAGS